VEHAAIVFFGVLYQAGVLFGKEELVRRDLAVAAAVVGRRLL
jgi:hypothetical protein